MGYNMVSQKNYLALVGQPLGTPPAETAKPSSDVWAVTDGHGGSVVRLLSVVQFNIIQMTQSHTATLEQTVIYAILLPLLK